MCAALYWGFGGLSGSNNTIQSLFALYVCHILAFFHVSCWLKVTAPEWTKMGTSGSLGVSMTLSMSGLPLSFSLSFHFSFFGCLRLKPSGFALTLQRAQSGYCRG